MGKLVKKDGKFLKKDGKFVTTDDPSKCPCCGGDGPCPPGKFCSWTPPDPCSTGKCTAFASDTPIECPEGFPYDCTSEDACNQWYAAHPNPPCDCWVCVDGEWVNQQDYAAECFEKGGYPGSAPPEGVECIPPVKYICAIREDSCAQFPLNYGQYQYRSDGVWAIRRSRCAGQIPADTCTIADPPSRPGAFPGEIVNVGCKAVAPITTKECITEEEFNRGGWTKVSGPHDTLQICEEACSPPPPDKECCVECDSGVYPESCDGCPDGFDCIEAGGAIFCIKSTPVVCGTDDSGNFFQDTIDAINECEQMGLNAIATQAPCREPPPDPRCLPPAICTWSPPDCGGECWLDAVWDESDPLPPAYCASRPYDCTSKSACEAWVQANPIPPCPERQADNPLP